VFCNGKPINDIQIRDHIIPAFYDLQPSSKRMITKASKAISLLLNEIFQIYCQCNYSTMVPTIISLNGMIEETLVKTIEHVCISQQQPTPPKSKVEKLKYELVSLWQYSVFVLITTY